MVTLDEPAEQVLLTPANSDALWYKDAIIYQLHVRAFRDSNGDGIGDFPGLTQNLDYLQDLGVTTLWLLPFYPSPLKDDGYDIANYVNVNPQYGTLADFERCCGPLTTVACASLPSWCSITPRTSTPGSSVPGMASPTAAGETSTSGAMTRTNMPTRESSSRTSRRAIGPGIPRRSPISGIVSTRTSPI